MCVIGLKVANLQYQHIDACSGQKLASTLRKNLFCESIFGEIIEGEFPIKVPPTIPLELFLENVPYSQVIVKSIFNADEYFSRKMSRLSTVQYVKPHQLLPA